MLKPTVIFGEQFVFPADYPDELKKKKYSMMVNHLYTKSCQASKGQKTQVWKGILVIFPIAEIKYPD